MQRMSGRGGRVPPVFSIFLILVVGALAAVALMANAASSEADAATKKAASGSGAGQRNPDQILGRARYSEAKVLRYARSKGASRYTLRAIPVYYDLAPKVGLAPDVLVAQSMIETGYGKYGGDAKPWNMAGIKKGGNVGDAPRDFERPKTAYQGVRMHVNHMAAYTNRKTVGSPHDRYYDAKSAQKSRGYWIRRVSQLGGGVWATDTQYSAKIKKILDEMSRA